MGYTKKKPNTQVITIKLKLHQPTLAKQKIYQELTTLTTAFANNLVKAGRPKKLTTKTAQPYLLAPMPSAVTGQAIRDVDSFKKVDKFKALPPCFNNQNLKLKVVGNYWTASFPTQRGRVRIPLVATEQQRNYLESIGIDIKQGAAKLYKKKNCWYLALSITVQVTPCVGTKIAGIDLGLRNLAVAVCENENLFFGGNQAAYVRRHFSALRKSMGKDKALSAIRRMKDKEARWMQSENHRISREIVNWCIARNVGIIRMENLKGIRIKNKRKNKDAGRSLNSWGFFQLQQFVTYKATLAGIKVESVVAKDTSRACPVCNASNKNNRDGIVFLCKSCNYKAHADVVGGINIANAISGLAAA